MQYVYVLQESICHDCDTCTISWETVAELGCSHGHMVSTAQSGRPEDAVWSLKAAGPVMLGMLRA